MMLNESEGLRIFNGMLTIEQRFQVAGWPCNLPASFTRGNTDFFKDIAAFQKGWPGMQDGFKNVEHYLSDLQRLAGVPGKANMVADPSRGIVWTINGKKVFSGVTQDASGKMVPKYAFIGGTQPGDRFKCFSSMRSVFQSVQKAFHYIYNDINQLRYCGIGSAASDRFCSKKGAGKPSTAKDYIYLNPNFKGHTKLSVFTAGGGKKKITFPPTAWKIGPPGQNPPATFGKFQSDMRGLISGSNGFNNAMDNFNRGAKNGGSNIVSMQTTTQSQVKLYMLYYQEVMQTAPSLIQSLAELIMAVAQNMKGGQ